MFHRTLRDSTLLTGTARDLLPATAPSGGLGDILRLLAEALPDEPSIVVLDELRSLAEQEPTFGGHTGAPTT